MAYCCGLFASRAFNKHIDIKHGISSDIKKISKDEVKETLRTVSFVRLVMVLCRCAWYGATQAMTLLCSAFLGLSEAGTYSVMIQLTSGIYNVSSATCVRFSLIPVCLCRRGSYCATFDYCSRVVLLYSDVCIGHCIRYDISSISGLF